MRDLNQKLWVVDKSATGSEMDSSTSSMAKGNDSKTSDDTPPRSTSQTTPGEKDYDNSLIRKIYECVAGTLLQVKENLRPKPIALTFKIFPFLT